MIDVPIIAARISNLGSGARKIEVWPEVGKASRSRRRSTLLRTIGTAPRHTKHSLQTGWNSSAKRNDPGRKGTALEIAADGCTVGGSIIQNSATANGILISSNRNIIENNTLEGNAAGIQIASSNDNTIIGNMITGNSRAGILLRNAKNNLIEGNQITKNALGITLDEQSAADTITFNTFSNTENVLSKGTGLQWESPYEMSYMYLGRTFTGRLGNYWSDYRGTDQNSDGIGDTPYVVESGLNRNPAADQNEVDPSPLMDPIEYYSQLQRATSGEPEMTPTPGNTDITASARQGVPLADNGSAVTGERAGRPVVALFVLVLLVCIVGAGGCSSSGTVKSNWSIPR